MRFGPSPSRADARTGDVGCNIRRRRLLFAITLIPLPLVLRPAGAAPDLDRMQQLARDRYGEAAAQRVAAWRRLMQDIEDESVSEQLSRTNIFFNRSIRWVEDIDNWGEEDYWASPLETMGHGAGDCEDYSIAKYMTLKLLGIPNEQMRLIYVRARIGGRSQAHMVLGFYQTPDAEPLILDNLIGEIRPASRRPDLDPVFSFNSDGLWVGDATQSRANPTARLSRWGRVLERMQREGLR